MAPPTPVEPKLAPRTPGGGSGGGGRGGTFCGCGGALPPAPLENPSSERSEVRASSALCMLGTLCVAATPPGASGKGRLGADVAPVLVRRPAGGGCGMATDGKLAAVCMSWSLRCALCASSTFQSLDAIDAWAVPPAHMLRLTYMHLARGYEQGAVEEHAQEFSGAHQNPLQCSPLAPTAHHANQNLLKGHQAERPKTRRLHRLTHHACCHLQPLVRHRT